MHPTNQRQRHPPFLRMGLVLLSAKNNFISTSYRRRRGITSCFRPVFCINIAAAPLDSIYIQVLAWTPGCALFFLKESVTLFKHDDGPHGESQTYRLQLLRQSSVVKEETSAHERIEWVPTLFLFVNRRFCDDILTNFVVICTFLSEYVRCLLLILG